MKELQRKITDRLIEAVSRLYGVPAGDVTFSIPPQREYGDLSTNLAFSLAGRVQKSPREIGQQIVEALGKDLDFIRQVTVAGGGFVNFFFKNEVLFEYLLENRDQKPRQRGEKVIVEHTSINPNKAAHIGHLRNSILGDTLARILSYLGYRVEVQNYIDDTGIQVADVVWGLLRYRGKTPEQVREIPDLPVYLWDLYARVSREINGDDALKRERDDVHQRIERGLDPEAGVCRYLSQAVLKDHIRIMDRLGIRYDLLVKESDIISLSFFDQVKEVLARAGILYPSRDPEKEGCQVILYERGKTEKVIIRSNQTLTYIAKDLAYAFWKMGLIDGDFHYAAFHSYADGHTIYSTRDRAGGEDSAAPARENFGGGDQAYNVIGIRQAYLQEIISQVIDTLPAKDKRYVHFYYEMVSLSPACVRDLGLPLSPEDEKKKAIDVSGRRGIAVTADHLVDELYQQALREVRSRDQAPGEGEREDIARRVAAAALRYFMIRFNSTSPITFDFREALAFEGNSGPYILYSVVRINSIMRKLGLSEEQAYRQFRPAFGQLADEEQNRMSEILLLLGRIELEVEFALKGHDLSILAAYTYKVAQKINHYYHLYPVIAEKDGAVRGTRILFFLYARQKLVLLASLLGISIPDRM